jgi:nitrite reductase (NADH) small subunit
MGPEWVEIGRIDDIPRCGARTVRTAGLPIAVFRTGEDEIFALADRCPHRGGPLSQGIVFGRSVACPLHDWVIDLDSGQARPPDTGCAPSIPVRVIDRRVFLPAAVFGRAPAGGACETAA